MFLGRSTEILKVLGIFTKHLFPVGRSYMEVFLERDGGRKVILFCVWLLRLGLGAVPPIFWAGPRCLGVSVKILKVMGIRTGKPKCLDECAAAC